MDYTVHGISPGQNTEVGSFSLSQRVFPVQGSNPGLPRCRRGLYQLNHKESPRILVWVAYPFSRGSSRPRNWTWVSCTAGRFFTSWGIREALKKQSAFPECLLYARAVWMTSTCNPHNHRTWIHCHPPFIEKFSDLPTIAQAPSGQGGCWSQAASPWSLSSYPSSRLEVGWQAKVTSVAGRDRKGVVRWDPEMLTRSQVLVLYAI